MSYSSSGVRRHDPNSAVQAKPVIVEQVQRIDHAFHQVAPNLDSVRRAQESSSSSEAVPNLQPKVSGILGCTGTLFGGIKLVNNNRQYAHVVGSCLILTSVSDESQQLYLVDPSPPRPPVGSPVAQHGSSNAISALAVSNSGRWLAVGSNGTPADVVLWDCEASPPVIVARLQHHTDGIRCLDFSPDDRFLLTAGDDTDKKLFVYDMMPYTSSNRPPALVTNSTSEGVLRVAFGPRTKDPRGNITALYQVATANHERVEFFIFDPVKGSFSATGRVMLGAIKRKINTLQWDPTGTLVFAGSTSGDVCIVLASTRILVQTITPSPSASGAVGAVTFLNGGREVLVGRKDGTVTTYRAGATLNANYVDIAQFKVGGSITSFVLGDGFAICGTEESTISKVDMQSKSVKRLSQSHVAPLRDVSFSRDPSVRAFATSGLDGSVQVFDTDTLQQISMCGQLIPAGEARGRESVCVCLSPPQLLVGYNNGTVRSYNYATGAELWQVERAHKTVSSIAVGPTQRYWVSGGSDGELRCWNFVSRALITEVKEHSAPINGVAIFADAQRILSVSHDKRLVETDLPNAKLVSLHENRMGGISGIVLSPDEKEIITVGKDNAVSFWRLQSAHPTAVIAACHGANGEPLCIALSNSGRIFATGDASGRIFLWHTKSRKQLNTLDAHTGAVRKLAFSPDDSVLISVGDDGAIIKWTL